VARFPSFDVNSAATGTPMICRASSCIGQSSASYIRVSVWHRWLNRFQRHAVTVVSHRKSIMQKTRHSWNRVLVEPSIKSDHLRALCGDG